MPEKHWGTNSVPPDVATRNARPHTAHGLRESDIAKGRGEAAPVVASARGMMRYTIHVCETGAIFHTYSVSALFCISSTPQNVAGTYGRHVCSRDGNICAVSQYLEVVRNGHLEFASFREHPIPRMTSGMKILC